ncbi:Ig-like domain-containing protein [Methanosphaera stadtmanae]|uniref:Ig-like domain-containing protein n=1 Tax=Methanosphaera stadtmanae TaxID=2317 RepID=UPI002E77103F|nr:Ig-like domain-containing protein [Methanosphaera stadtmanae]
MYVGDTSNLYAYVYANNRATINSGMMSFTLDGELIGTEYVSNNTANIEYIIPSTLTEGKHTLLVEYLGDESYNTSSKEITLTLAKTSTTTTLRTWTVNNEKIVLNTTVRAWNKTINSGNVNVYIDNIFVATGQVTDNYAVITLPSTVDTDTSYNLKLEYTGTDLLNSSTYSVDEFIFNKKSTSTRIYPYLRSNGTLTLTAYVYSDNYAKVNTGNVIFYINNKQVTTAPVANNKASTVYYMGDYDAGNYTIKATYNGSKQFNTSTNTSSVTKNPYYHTTYMSLTNNSLTVKRGGSTDINATLTCYSRNITEDIQATIELNATWGTVVYTQDVTFHNGVLNYKFTLPSDFEIFTFYGKNKQKLPKSIKILHS